MAIYRTVSLSFWTDSKVTDDFTPEDKYFYLYLFTNPHTNLAGCYEISIRQMAYETGYSKETVERLIERFKYVHKIIDYSTESKEILLINWHKYNWTSSEKFRKPLLAEINKIKEENYKNYLINVFNGSELGYGIDTKCIDTNCTDTSVTVSVSDSVSESINKKDNYMDSINNILSKRNYSECMYSILITWITYKKEKGQTYKTTGLNTLLNKIDKALLEHTEQELVDLINECMSRNYAGIILDMLNKSRSNSSSYMDAIKNRVSQVDDWV